MKNYLNHPIPVLHCKDVSDSISYYENQLGFEQSWNHEGIYGATFNGEFELHLMKTEKEFTSSYIYAGTPDVDKLYEFLKTKDVKIAITPVDRFYGLRECTIQDLNGHYITFSSQIIGREPDVPKEN